MSGRDKQCVLGMTDLRTGENFELRGNNLSPREILHREPGTNRVRPRDNYENRGNNLSRKGMP